MSMTDKQKYGRNKICSFIRKTYLIEILANIRPINDEEDYGFAKLWDENSRIIFRGVNFEDKQNKKTVYFNLEPAVVRYLSVFSDTANRRNIPSPSQVTKEKISQYGYSKNWFKFLKNKELGNGRSLVTTLKIIHQPFKFDTKTDKTVYATSPWIITIENGSGLPKGTMGYSDYQKTDSISIFLSTEEYFVMLGNMERYIEAWVSAHGSHFLAGYTRHQNLNAQYSSNNKDSSNQSSGDTEQVDNDFENTQPTDNFADDFELPAA